MKRRAARDDLTMAYMRYVAAWLGSWSTRRKLEQSRRRRRAKQGKAEGYSVPLPAQLKVLPAERDPSTMHSDKPHAATA
jgi:hypothetical protein